LLEAVGKEEEGGTFVFLFFLIGEAECAFEVVFSSCKNLELIKPSCNELNELSGTLLELRNTLCLTELGEFCFDLTKVASSPGHELSLCEAIDFVQLELILDVDDGLATSSVILFLLISCDQDSLFAFGDILSLGLNHGVIHNELVGVGV